LARSFYQSCFVAFAKANRPTQEKFRLIATAQFASVTELLKGASAL